MKVLFLFPYPLGQSPSQRFRFEQYLHELTTAGFTCTYHSFWNITTWSILYKSGHYWLKIGGFMGGALKRVLILFNASEADFVFIHRECLPVGPPVIEWIIAKILRKKIIFDFDDAIWLPNTTDENKIASLIKWHKKTSAICRWSYKISCGNKYLANFAKQYASKVVTNPTTIDTMHLHNPTGYTISKPENVITIGWTGTHSTLKYLDAVVPIIQKLEDRYRHLRFVVIANKKPELLLRSLTFIPWSKENEIKDLMQFDIGIMPLTNDVWAQGKCGFKALQYMALCIPTVASPIGINTEIITHNTNGFLCNTPEDWFEYLTSLIEQTELRNRIGLAGRKKIIDCYSVLSNTSTFLSLFV